MDTISYVSQALEDSDLRKRPKFSTHVEKCRQEAEECEAGQDGHGVGRQRVGPGQDGVHRDDDRRSSRVKKGSLKRPSGI